MANEYCIYGRETPVETETVNSFSLNEAAQLTGLDVNEIIKLRDRGKIACPRPVQGSANRVYVVRYKQADRNYRYGLIRLETIPDMPVVGM
ncbi:MAG: hypothetical protein AB7O26_07445 [Planctomycetaceae bacterium]